MDAIDVDQTTLHPIIEQCDSLTLSLKDQFMISHYSLLFFRVLLSCLGDQAPDIFMYRIALDCFFVWMI